MKVSEVNQLIIGRRVSCVENGARVVGVITGISEDKYSVYVHIQFDEPLTCWCGDYNVESWVETEYKSWARKCDGWGNLQHTYFIDNLDWLASYMPKNEHYTDKFEIKEIADNLSLAYLTNEKLQETRDKVVMFYHNLIQKAVEEKDHNKRWDLSTAMMSVTAVIDYYKSQRGMEI